MAQRELEELVLVRMISAPPESVFKAWTEPDLMRKWLAPEPNVIINVDNELKPGGKLRIEMQGPDGTKHFINGEYQSLTPHSFVAKSWQYTGPIEIIQDIETLLEINLIPSGNFQTELTLTQSRLKTNEACEAFESGWPSCLDKLQNIFIH